MQIRDVAVRALVHAYVVQPLCAEKSGGLRIRGSEYTGGGLGEVGGGGVYHSACACHGGTAEPWWCAVRLGVHAVRL